MPCVPMRLTSSSLCICNRRTPPAHPGSRGRNRHQPQPFILEETRTGGGVLAVIETLSTQVGGEGGDCSPPLLERTYAWHPYSSYGGNYKACSSASVRPMLLAEHSHAPVTRVSREAAEPTARPRRGLSHQIDIERSTQTPHLYKY